MDIVGGQAATDDVGTDGSLLCSSGMTSHLSCCGESVLQTLAQNSVELGDNHCAGDCWWYYIDAANG